MYWFTATVGATCFQASRTRSNRPSTRRAPPGFTSPLLCRSLQSSFALASARAVSGMSSLPGFRPSSRHHQCASTFARLPSPRFVPSSGFRSLSTVFSALWLRGLFHPRATSRVRSRSGASHSHAAPPPSSGVAPPLPLDLRSARPAFQLGVRLRRPRLRGLVPRGVAFASAR